MRIQKNKNDVPKIKDNPENPEELLEFIRNNVSGRDAVFDGPFGLMKAVYCDYTASAKSLDYIEDYIREHVLPFYANTHTATSICGLQTSKFREGARKIIKKCVNASDEDVVIFTGSGVTGAIKKLIHTLQLDGDRASRTVVITGPYEHHSNILPWREIGVRTVRIPDTDRGIVDLKILEETLKDNFRQGYSIICSMSAASNVTGILVDTDAVTELVHKYGGMAFWDYATGAPYLDINMNKSSTCYKDAVFISPHKIVGGVGTPGVLVGKKKLFQNAVPDGCGGGTVVYVTRETHEYHRSIEEREEGGTPAIVEAIRAGMVFQLKDAITTSVIHKREHELCQRAFRCWRHNQHLQILGSYTAERLPIFSMLVYHPSSGKFLHHNFISQLLNDLYGIQVRGGCACAGPYAQDLLNMDEETAMIFASEFLTEEPSQRKLQKLEIMKPGFFRLNFPFFLDDETADFIIHAVDTVARNAWSLLPLYRFTQDGEWTHRNYHRIVRSLSQIQITPEGAKFPALNSMKSAGKVDVKDVAKRADDVFAKARDLCAHCGADKDEGLKLAPQLKPHVWFLQPSQAWILLMTPGLTLKITHGLPFWPIRRSHEKVRQRFRDLLFAAEKNGMLSRRLKILHDECPHPQTGRGKTISKSQEVNNNVNPKLQKEAQNVRNRTDRRKAKPRKVMVKSADERTVTKSSTCTVM